MGKKYAENNRSVNHFVASTKYTEEITMIAIMISQHQIECVGSLNMTNKSKDTYAVLSHLYLGNANGLIKDQNIVT